MEITEIQELIKANDFDKLQQKIISGLSINYADYAKQYKPAEHAIHDLGKRPKKVIEKGDGNVTSLDVARLSIPMQKMIVRLAAAFLCGNPIQLSANPKDGVKAEEDLLSLLTKVWEDNKLDYESKNLAKLMMSETECAELWYSEPADKDYWNDTVNAGKTVRFRMKILSASKGDTLAPVFNSFGDMIAFGRGYKIKLTDKTEEHFDLYTAEKIYLGIKTTGTWEIKPEDNLVQEIPIIYYKQDQVEWADVQYLIERYETVMSNHADTNDYFGSPLLLVNGEIEGFAEKGESGKVLKATDGATATFLSWTQSPESVKLEQQNLRSLIFDQTGTPDITKDNESLSGVQSGIALKMRFLPAHLKAAEKEEIFGKGIQRRINYLKNALGKINSNLLPALPMPIKPKFEYYLPKNDVEKIDMLTTAKQGGILSTKTAVIQNPLVSDPETEFEAIQEEGGTLQLNNP